VQTDAYFVAKKEEKSLTPNLHYVDFVAKINIILVTQK
jgi:hypothetical protein